MTENEEGCKPRFRRIGMLAWHMRHRPYYLNGSASYMNKRMRPKKKVVKPKRSMK